LEVYYHCCHRHWCKGVGDSKGEKQLLIIDKDGEFHQDVLTLGNNFKIKYEQLLKAYNGGHCGLDLIKNVTKTTKKYQYLKAQHYIILTKVVDEAIQIHFQQLHSKLSSVQSSFKEVNSYPFLCIIFIFFKFTQKTSNKT
jgi:hypothetical protein